MKDFYYNEEVCKRPTMGDHINILNFFVKSPIALALDFLEENVEMDVDVLGEDSADKINNSLCTIRAALVAWEQIDKKMTTDAINAAT